MTNPPIDAIREKLVIGTELFLGRDGDVSKDIRINCNKLKIASPVLKTSEYEKIKQLDQNGQKAVLQSILYDYVPENGAALQQALEALLKKRNKKLILGQRSSF